MKTWMDLYRAHTDMRATAGKQASEEIRQRLRALAERQLCDRGVMSRFTYKKNSPHGLREMFLSYPDGSVEMTGLPHLPQARLQVLLLVGTRENRLHHLTVTVVGRRSDDTPLCISVELADDRLSPSHPDRDQQGSGACGHAAFHCHVGPTHTTPPEVRVPLPALVPGAAIDWVLSQVVPDWEPAPWPDVRRALNGG